MKTAAALTARCGRKNCSCWSGNFPLLLMRQNTTEDEEKGTKAIY